MVAQQETIVGENNSSWETTSQENVKEEDMMVKLVNKGKRARSPSSPLALTSDSQCGFGSNWGASKEEEDMAHSLILLAQGGGRYGSTYDCKTCNRSFHSFQALGGHRASHKKPKLPVTILHPKKSSLIFNLKKNNSNDRLSDNNVSLALQMASSTPTKVKVKVKVKVHECAICGAQFSSGQALGGHMRRHRLIGVPSSNPTAVKVEKAAAMTTNNLLSLDLNLPAPEEDHIHYKNRSEFGFGTNEKTLVFTPPSLVDCHY